MPLGGRFWTRPSGESCIEITPTSIVVIGRSGSSGARIDTSNMPPDHADGAAATAQSSPLTSRGTHTQHGRGGRDGQTNGSTDSGQGRGCRRGCGGAGNVSGERRRRWSAADDSWRNRVCTTGWAATSRSPRSSTASATRSSETRYSTRTPRSRRGTGRRRKTRLPGLKFGRTLWIAAAAGGPFVYTGLPLNEAHAEFNLTADEFAEVGAEIVRALDFYGVPEREQQELVDGLQSQHVRRRDGSGWNSGLDVTIRRRHRSRRPRWWARSFGVT